MGIWYDQKAYDLLKKCSDAKDLATSMMQVVVK